MPVADRLEKRKQIGVKMIPRDKVGLIELAANIRNDTVELRPPSHGEQVGMYVL